MNRLTIAVLPTFVVILVGSGLLAYVLSDSPQRATKSTATPSGSPGAQVAAPAVSDKDASSRVVG